MLFGESRAQRRHGGWESALRERDHVHITFGDDNFLRVAERFPRFCVIIKRASFVEERRIA